VAVHAQPAASQTPEQEVIARRLDYEAARTAFEAANAAFNVVDREYSEAANRFLQARQSGNQDAIARAFSDALAKSVPLRAQKQRVTDVAAKLRTARQAFMDAISGRLEELVAQMDAAASRQRRDSLDAVFRDLNNQLHELDSEAQGTLSLRAVALPDITYDPRDSSVELEQKAQILERRAAVNDTLIQYQDRQIKQLQERQRLERQRRDFMAGAGRFDDTRTPVLSGAAGADARLTVVDSAGTDPRPLTLEERIDALQQYRAQLVEDRDQLLIRAAEFRKHVRMVT
jgi:hypothetical protein